MEKRVQYELRMIMIENKKFEHSLPRDWWEDLPHPIFRQNNCLICKYCKMILCYTYRGKEYGINRDKAVYFEIPKCRDAKIDRVIERI